MSFAARQSVGGFPAVTRSYTSGTGATETAPTGCSQVTIQAWGGGGGGADGWFSDSPEVGGDGAAGGYSRSVYSITGGQTLTYTVGANGVRGANGTAGGNTTVVSGTRTITSMSAGGGGGGTDVNGTPGAVSGGTQVNEQSSSLNPIVGLNGVYGGDGGDGRLYPQQGTNGVVGKVVFIYE